jgi:hypothetical protein
LESQSKKKSKHESQNNTAQQRGRTIRFDAIGVGRRGRWRLTGDHDQQQKRQQQAIRLSIEKSK